MNVHFPELEPLPAPIAKKAGAFLHAQNWMGLALHLPLRFEDHATLVKLDALTPGNKANITATVVGHEVVRGKRKQLKVWVEDEGVQLLLRWLHFYPSQIQKMPVGSRLKISGLVRQGYGTIEMIHPTVTQTTPRELTTSARTTTETSATDHSEVVATRTDTETLSPVYPGGAGVKQTDWQRWINGLPRAAYQDTLEATLLIKHKLLPWNEALQTLHGVANSAEIQSLNERTHPSWIRVKVDELLAQQLLMRQYRAHRQQQTAPVLSLPASQLRAKFLNELGFTLTRAQERATIEIDEDLTKPYPMQRLLQGDVGSGKTLVAALACLKAIANGMQAAILAPTEVLAQQHHHKLNSLMTKIGITCARLQGSMPTKEKKATLEGLADGSVQLVIGTHALVQSSVNFAMLGLAVVDEQHRFGVGQRLELISKAQGESLAHQLMMSATPIPRTLAQTYLSDLAVSNLDEKPPGRKPIITKLLSQSKREQLISAIDTEIAKGQQVYWVCPLIEESEVLDLQAAENTYKDLCEALPHREIALLHGKQDAKLKQATMDLFASGQVKLLVSTTVIEVGVDVGNASLMVIDQAERFGLAQLHQLRGRVGRGSIQSICVLLYGKGLSQTAKTRLKAMHESDDGFYLAEIDLELRGPGELLGKRQSGVPMLRYADPLLDKDLTQVARQIAEEIQPGSEAETRHIRRWLQETPWWLS